VVLCSTSVPLLRQPFLLNLLRTVDHLSDIVTSRSTRAPAKCIAADGRSTDADRVLAAATLSLASPTVLTRSFTFTRVWRFDFGAMSNSLNVYVSYLRRKTEIEGEPRLIHTVRGVGYVLRAS
jgi:DNA-binding response OmpR family regulator